MNANSKMNKAGSEEKKFENRATELMKRLSDGLYERNEVINKTLLALLAGESVFMFGPPGTAKSLIARRVAQAFVDESSHESEEGVRYFEHLMNRFSTPDEVFGPVSIKALKEDRYVRKTRGYLPDAHIAFLDEIWKASPAILNTLLTLVNEHVFKNDGKVENSPLRGLIAASNEIPPEGQGLEALYDRFVMRLKVLPMTERESFEKYLQAKPIDEKIKPKRVRDLQFNAADWIEVRGRARHVGFSQSVLEIVHSIRVKLQGEQDREGGMKIYVSDRRWKKAVGILQMAATLCDRKQVLPIDAVLLENMIWSKPEDCARVHDLVFEAIRENVIGDGGQWDRLAEEYRSLEKRWNETAFYQQDEYDNVCTDPQTKKSCVPVQFQIPDSFYGGMLKYEFKCPLDFLNNPTDEEPVTIGRRNRFGEERKDDAEVQFIGNRKFSVKVNGTKLIDLMIEPSHEKGSPKVVDAATADEFVREIIAIQEGVKMLKRQAEDCRVEARAAARSPFVTVADREWIGTAIQDWIEKITDWQIESEKLVDGILKHPCLMSQES